jgi:hypothetical protein
MGQMDDDGQKMAKPVTREGTREGLWIDPPGAAGAVEGGRGLFWGL